MCGFCCCCYCCFCSWQCILTSRRTQIAKTAPWLAFSTLFHARSPLSFFRVVVSVLLFASFSPSVCVCVCASWYICECICVCVFKVVSLWQARIDLPESCRNFCLPLRPFDPIPNHLHKIKSHRKINFQCVAFSLRSLKVNCHAHYSQPPIFVPFLRFFLFV